MTVLGRPLAKTQMLVKAWECYSATSAPPAQLTQLYSISKAVWEQKHKWMDIYSHRGVFIAPWNLNECPPSKFSLCFILFTAIMFCFHLSQSFFLSSQSSLPSVIWDVSYSGHPAKHLHVPGFVSEEQGKAVEGDSHLGLVTQPLFQCLVQQQTLEILSGEDDRLWL